MAYISRDPFARSELHRELLAGFEQPRTSRTRATQIPQAIHLSRR